MQTIGGGGVTLGRMLSDTLSCSLHTDIDYGSYCLSSLEMGLMAGVTGRQGMLAPPWHLLPPLMCSEVRVCPLSDLCFLWDL